MQRTATVPSDIHTRRCPFDWALIYGCVSCPSLFFPLHIPPRVLQARHLLLSTSANTLPTLCFH